MADKSPLAYLPETSEEAIEANRNYQEALQRLNASLDQRKNRFFDPRYMAAAQAFLSPTKTGSFFESLGTAAGAVGQAQEGLLREEQDIAKLKFDVAGQGLALQRQRELDRMYEQAMSGGKPPALPAGPAAPGGGALPEAGAPAGGALPGGAPSSAEPTRVAGSPQEPQGIQIAPARTGLITRDQYLAGARAAGTPLAEALKNWEEIQRKRREFRDGVVFDEETGRTFSAPRPDPVKRQFPTADGFQTWEVDSITAAEYDDAIRRGDRAAIARIVERVTQPGGRVTPTEGAPRLADHCLLKTSRRVVDKWTPTPPNLARPPQRKKHRCQIQMLLHAASSGLAAGCQVPFRKVPTTLVSLLARGLLRQLVT